MCFTALLLLASAPAFPQASGRVRLVEVARGFSSPVDIAHAGDASGRLFVVEQRGRIRIVRDNALLPAPFLDISARVSCCGERGLLGLAFPPGFREKQHFYVNYTNRDGHTVIARYRVTSDPDLAGPASETVLLTVEQPYSNHNGGQIVFGPGGDLYVGMGDGGSGGDPHNHAQNPASLLGKMLRIDVESGAAPYRVPAGNPFVSSPGYRPEIWATGLRNPWRFSFDRSTGDLWIGDVGQNRYEEIHFAPASSAGGENYGWNRMEAAHCFSPSSGCSQAGLTLPVVEYGRTGGCSVTGGFVYRGARFAALQGLYLYADYCSGNIWGLERAASGWKNELLLASRFAVSTFGEDDEGNLYLADHGAGRVYLVAAGSPAFSAPDVVNGASFTSGLAPGSISTLFGAGITGINGILQAPGFPLPRALNGVEIRVNGVPAPLYALANVNGREQINWQAPEELVPGTRASVVVSNNGAGSPPVEVDVLPQHPGIFTLDGAAAAALHNATYQLVSSSSPAGRGEEIALYATGLGAVDRPPGTGNAAPAATPARALHCPPVTVAGLAAEVTFCGLAPGAAGLYQLNLRIPSGAPSGVAEVRVGASPPAWIAVR